MDKCKNYEKKEVGEDYKKLQKACRKYCLPKDCTNCSLDEENAPYDCLIYKIQKELF